MSSRPLAKANDALFFQFAVAASCSAVFFSSKCWSAIAIATWVLTCSSWFSISSTSCLSIFSGSSALSIKSLRLARRRVVTRSMSAMSFSFRSTPRCVGRVTICTRVYLSHIRHQIGHFHSTERFEKSRDLRGNFGHFAGYLMRADVAILARGDDGDFIYLGQRLCHRTHHIGQVGDELVDDGRLRPLLIGFGLDVHGLGFGFAFLQNDRCFRLTLNLSRGGVAFGFRHQASTLAIGEVLDPLLLDF